MSKWFSNLFATIVCLSVSLSMLLCSPAGNASAETYTVPKTASAKISWDPNIPNPDGYRIYQRKTGQAYNYGQPVWTGSTSSGTIYNLEYDTTYFFVVRAYVGTIDSIDSDEVSFTAKTPVPATYTISTVAGEHGTITPTGETTIIAGADQTFTIKPDSNYQIADVKVDGVSKGAISSYTFTQVTGNHTIAATFKANTYQITASAGANGSISPTGTSTVNHGASKSYTITAAAGYQIADVKVDGVSKGAISSHTFTQVTGNHTIAATFKANTYQITASAGANGSISPTGTSTVNHGASKSYTITAAAGYHVADVNVDGVSVGQSKTYTFDQIDRNHSIQATFAVNTYSITASAGNGGAISPAGLVKVTHGGSQTYAVKANSGRRIADVLVDGQSLGPVGSFTFNSVTGDHTIMASFAETRAVTIQIEAEDGNISLPMEIGDHTAASAGGYIWAPLGTKTAQSASGGSGHAEYRFQIQDAGDYVIWGRQVSNDQNSDSFFVALDGQTEMVWHTRRGGREIWTWDAITQRNDDESRDVVQPEHFFLSAGTHTLRISQRESGTKLDKILITNQVELETPVNDAAVKSMEFGDVKVDHRWTRVAFEQTFVNPVVVAGPISLNGEQPAVVRIKNVGSTGFDIRLQEYEYLDGVHAVETVSYLVMEQGTHMLEDGTKIEAGKLETDATNIFQTVVFKESFTIPPVVMTTLTSFNDANAATGRVRQVNLNGFSYRMQEQEANTPDHGRESLSYIAWEPSSGAVCGIRYLVEKTADTVGSTNYDIALEKPLTDAPVFLAEMQTADGGDTANVRCTYKENASIGVLIDEEQSRDEEVDHTTEAVGYIILSRNTSNLSDVMEFGEVRINHQWTRVDFKIPFINPVVVAGPLSLNGEQPAVIRIQNVDAGGFEIRIQEWDYLDGSHIIETVDYLVIEQGTYTLEDGTVIEAGTLSTSAANGFQTVAFNGTFNTKPVVMAALTSYNDDKPVTGRMKQITTGGFSYRMQEQEANAQDHGMEILSFIAWEPSYGTVGDVSYMVERTADVVTSSSFVVNTGASFAAEPILLADMQTADGGDTANVRCSYRNNSSFGLLIDEETSQDTEEDHTTEVIGYMMLSR